MSRARGSRVLLQHIFRPYARRNRSVSESALNLFHVDRRGIGHLSIRSFRTLFRSFGVRRAIRRSHVSYIVPRCNSSFYPILQATLPPRRPVRDTDSRSTTRRLAHRNFSLSIRALLFLLLHTLCDTCAKSESGKRLMVSTIIYDKAGKGEASIRRILRSLRIPTTTSEFRRIWPRGTGRYVSVCEIPICLEPSLTRLMNCGIYTGKRRV